VTALDRSSADAAKIASPAPCPRLTPDLCKCVLGIALSGISRMTGAATKRGGRSARHSQTEGPLDDGNANELVEKLGD
jgi:hypothetical protein